MNDVLCTCRMCRGTYGFAYLDPSAPPPSLVPRPALLATIRESSPRAETWRALFGGSVVPLLCADPVALPVLVSDECPTGIALVFLVDVKRLAEAQLDRVVERLAEVSGTPVEQVRHSLQDPKFRVSIPAKDLVIASSEPGAP